MVLKVLGQEEEPSAKWPQAEGPTLQPSTLDELQALEEPEEPPQSGHCPVLMGALLLQPSLPCLPNVWGL